MVKEIEVVVDARIGFDVIALRKEVLNQQNIPDEKDVHLVIKRRSIDARSRQVKTRVLVQIYQGQLPISKDYKVPKLKSVHGCPQVVIVGAGPAGLFAALKCLEFGIKPIVLDRGKDVQSRRRDLAAINKNHIVNSDSNYCFGEGGAGTYSDGKLYTRATKRGDVERILQILHAHGAREEILYDAHPHIGTNKLPKLIENIRETILEKGGEIYFEERVIDLVLSSKTIKGVKTFSGKFFEGRAVLLATGHSARDIYELLHSKGIRIEAKPFALGVRVEHSQDLIDQIQYHCDTRESFLPAASYSLNSQISVGNRPHGVFSFCMCPGGFIVPSATSQEEVVVNGMSPSRRDSKFSNSGIVISIDLEDLNGDHLRDPLIGLELQKNIENRAWLAGGKSQVAPAQLLLDFIEKRHSNHLLETSYQPGLNSVVMDDVLPQFISTGLRNGFKSFGKKMKGYLTNEAQIVGVESRTSSPVRIPRDPLNCEHTEVKGLFPCGEGAGFAGGIVSAAMDGERCIEGIKNLYF